MEGSWVIEHETAAQAISLVGTFLSISEKSFQDVSQFIDYVSTLIRGKGADVSTRRSLDELEASIELLKYALNALPQTYPDRDMLLESLAQFHLKLYRKKEIMNDFEECAIFARRALDSTAKDSSAWADRLSFLGTVLSEAATQGWDANPENAIIANQDWLALQTEEESDQHATGLDIEYHDFQTSKFELSELELRISVARRASKCRSVIDQEREGKLSKHLRWLELLYRRKCHQEVMMSGLEAVICTMRKNLRLNYESVYDYVYALEFQAELLVKHFLQTRTTSILEEAIDTLREIFRIPSRDYYNEGVGRTLLVSCLCLLAQQQSSPDWSGNMEDYYDEATSLARNAFESLPLTWLRHDEYLTYRASHFEERYWVSHDLRDLDRAIDLGKKALDLTPKGHPLRLFRLEWLEDFLDQKVAISETSDDIHKMIQISRLILDEAPQDDQETLSLRYLSLGQKLEQEYNKKGTINSLREAIQLSTNALRLTTNNLDKSDHFRSLGTWYGIIQQKTQDKADLKSSIFFFQRSLEVLSSEIDSMPLITSPEYDGGLKNGVQVSRLQQIMPLITGYCVSHMWRDAYEILHDGISFISKMSLRSLTVSNRRVAISATAGIASFAAGLALIVGKGPLVALALVEKSRNVFASSLEDLRVEVSGELQQLHPGLAAKFMSLRYQVSRPGITLRQFESGGGRAKAAWQLDHVIEEISRKPGFENFLMSPNEEDTREISSSGPVVVITTCPMRCDAIIIQPHQVRGLKLSHLSYEDILDNMKRGNINNLKVLEWLWDVLTSPILDALGLTQSPGDGEAWPRIWWIPIGPLSKFPIHAAGYHRHRTKNTVMDRVASSYSTSVNSMIQTRRRATPAQSRPERAVLVSVPQTKGHATLKFVKEEATRVGSLCRSMGFDVIEPQPRMESVAPHMAGCKIFHFAGHGSVNPSDPSLSQLLLEDWKTQEFTVAMIQEMNLRSGSPFLAYLSACGTGRIRQSSHLDENTHLISAFRIAGFRHVIGTLWEVNDECCVRVAERTYEEMLNQGISDDAVCLGLHKATREARDEWEQRADASRDRLRKQGRTHYLSVDRDRDIEECDTNDDLQVPEWVPYVHFGV